MKELIKSKMVKDGIMIVLVALILSSYTETREQQKPQVKIVERVISEQVPELEFSVENLKSFMEQINMKFIHIVMAQAQVESGYFTSKIFMENHNMFGMKQARQRQTVAIGTGRNHAMYLNWQDCVIDYALYQARYLSKVKSEEDYYAYLKGSYAGDPDYINKVRKLAENFKNY